MSIYALMLMPLIVINISCSEDEEKKSNTDLLTQKSWKLTKVEMKTDDGTFDFTSGYMDECEGDNTYSYTANGNFASAVGTDTCDGDEEEESGTWSWKENETVLAITVDGYADEAKLIELNDSLLKVNGGSMSYDMNQDGIDDTEVEIILTFSH